MPREVHARRQAAIIYWVFYINDKAVIERIAIRLSELGYDSVEAENPYWSDKGITIEDPDGWRIVLMNSPGISRRYR